MCGSMVDPKYCVDKVLPLTARNLLFFAIEKDHNMIMSVCYVLFVLLCALRQGVFVLSCHWRAATVLKFAV